MPIEVRQRASEKRRARGIVHGQLRQEPSGWSNWNGFHAYNCLMTPACLGIITRYGKDGRVAHNGIVTVEERGRANYYREFKLSVLRVYCCPLYPRTLY